MQSSPVPGLQCSRCGESRFQGAVEASATMEQSNPAKTLRGERTNMFEKQKVVGPAHTSREIER